MAAHHTPSRRDDGRENDSTPYRWIILGLGILAYGSSLFARQNYSGVQRFVAQDLHLDKGTLGLLGSVFFYTYAFAQMPWGLAADKFGSRWVTSAGVLLTAFSMLGFASAHGEIGVFVWRAVSGIGGAAAYVAMSGGVAHWFPPRERGVSQSALAGVGGGFGESTAFFLLPFLAAHLTAGWRSSMLVVAAGIAVVGVFCAIGLRSTPERGRVARPASFEAELLRDPRLWVYTFLFCAFIMGLRGTQTWLVAYVSDVFAAHEGVSLNEAAVRGGLLVTLAYSICGRGVGCPLAGKLSDLLAQRGILRTTISFLWLLVGMMLLLVLVVGRVGIVLVWALGVLLGVSMNLFPLIAAAITETYGVEKTASILGFVNMMGQLSSASMLAISGYVGLALSTQSGNSLDEYRGIWLSALISVALLTTLGWVTRLAINRRWMGVPMAQV